MQSAKKIFKRRKSKFNLILLMLMKSKRLQGTINRMKMKRTKMQDFLTMLQNTTSLVSFLKHP